MSRSLALLICTALGSVFAVAQVRELPTPAAGAAVANQYIVTFRAGTSQAERAAIVSRAGASLRFNYSIIDAAAIVAPNVNALAALGNSMAVLRIVPDRISSTMVKPGTGGGTTGQLTGEGVKRVGLPASANPYKIGVAVLDTGVARVPDLQVSTSFFDGYGGTCNDVDGHGTHVSGIVAAVDNSIGILGVAPGATIYCAKVLNDSGRGADSVIIAGLDWVFAQDPATVNPPIRIVNMSLGREKVEGDVDGPLHQAIQRVASKGIVVVVAAGNDASKEVGQMVPSGFPEVIAVASTTAIGGANKCPRLAGAIAADTASYFTTDGALDTARGIGVTISAPGEEKEDVSRACFISSTGILSLAPGGGTARMSGTSQAAPHVAGVAARILWTNASLLPEGVRQQLILTAEGKGTAPLNSPTSSYTFDGQREGIAKAP